MHSRHNRRKLILALILMLWAVPAWAGPLTTSFHPGLPTDLEFGDSPLQVQKKMGRPPDGQTGGPAFHLLTYSLAETERLQPERLDFRFEGDRLQSLSLILKPITIYHEDLEFTSRPIDDIKDYLNGLYGPFHWCGREDSCPFLPLAAWPRDDQILYLAPDSGSWSQEQEKSVKLSLWLTRPADEGENLPSLGQWQGGLTGCIKPKPGGGWETDD
jgi:hypothetical protein